MRDGDEDAERREWERHERRKVIVTYARLRPNGKPMFCRPSRLELEGAIPRRQGERTDGKVIYDSRQNAEAAGREMEKLGADPLRSFACNRSRNGHFHLTRDTARPRTGTIPGERV